MAEPVYLDYAAATPMDSAVLKAMEPYFSDEFYNPSAIYLAARNVRKAVEGARADVAGVIGARPAEVIFTAGATEANNLAIQGVMRAHPGGEILASAIEHDSVIAPAGLFTHELIPVNSSGLIDLDRLEKLITEKTVLISVGLINNEIGVIQPLKEIASLIEKIRKKRQVSGNDRPLYLHSDAAQAGNFLDLNVARLGVDLMSLNGGKIYGPKQSGALYVKTGTILQPLIVGGGQEQGLRSGTENVAAAVGFAEALKAAQDMHREEALRVAALRDKFVKTLEETVPAALINRPSKTWAPHIISVTFPSEDNERLMMELDEAGIICAVGSACSASSDEPSHVLSAIGLSTEDARATLRFSLGRRTSEEAINKTISVLTQIVSS